MDDNSRLLATQRKKCNNDFYFKSTIVLCALVTAGSLMGILTAIICGGLFMETKLKSVENDVDRFTNLIENGIRMAEARMALIESKMQTFADYATCKVELFEDKINTFAEVAQSKILIFENKTQQIEDNALGFIKFLRVKINDLENVISRYEQNSSSGWTLSTIVGDLVKWFFL